MNVFEAWHSYTTRKGRVGINWMLHSDVERVVEIEHNCFQCGWTAEELHGFMSQRNCLGMVAKINDQILGFMLYELHAKRVELVAIGIESEHRRNGIGRSFVQYLVARLSLSKRNRIETHVRETNLDAQLFFRSQGFRCEEVLRDWYDHDERYTGNDDAYLFVYRCGR